MEPLLREGQAPGGPGTGLVSGAHALPGGGGLVSVVPWQTVAWKRSNCNLTERGVAGRGNVYFWGERESERACICVSELAGVRTGNGCLLIAAACDNLTTHLGPGCEGVTDTYLTAAGCFSLMTTPSRLSGNQRANDGAREGGETHFVAATLGFRRTEASPPGPQAQRAHSP